jgi:heme/copper-type cytochrome/quinol oxidase subunit 2
VLTKPEQAKYLSHFFTLVVFIVTVLLFIPSIIFFACLVKPVSSGVHYKTSQNVNLKILLTIIAVVLTIATVTPMLIKTYPDLTYLKIGFCGLACMLVRIWIFRLPQPESKPSEINNTDEASSHI